MRALQRELLDAAIDGENRPQRCADSVTRQRRWLAGGILPVTQFNELIAPLVKRTRC